MDKSPWISTADQFPPDDAGVVFIHSYESGFGAEWADDIDGTVTHWMPIPPLPVAGETAE